MNRQLIGKQKKSGDCRDETTRLLKGLEGMRDELGPLAEELIDLLRDGSTSTSQTARPAPGRTGHKH